MIRFPEILRNAEAGAGGGDPPAGGGDAAAAAAAAAAGAGGAAGGEAKPWYEPFGLDEPSRQFIADRKFDRADGLPALIKSSIESDRMARSRNVLEKPDPAKLNEWAGWAELGWKPKYEEYTLKKPQTPEGFTYLPTFEETIRKIGHETKAPLAVTQAFLDAAIKFAVSEIDATDAKGARANAELDAKLKTDWGGDFDRNVELSKRAAAFVGISQDDQAELEGIIGSARMMAMFHKIGGMIGEDALVTSTGGALPASVDALRAELRRLQADPEWMKSFQNQRAANHKDVVAQRQQLIDKIAAIELKPGR